MSGASARTVAFETLGCKLNQYETDSIATSLRRRGYRVSPLGAGADAYIVNSCTVTNKADRKSRNTFYRAERLARAGTPIILTGCFVDNHAGIDHDDSRGSVTYVVNNAHKNTIPDLLDAHFRGETVDPGTLDPDVFGFTTPEQVFHTRTNIKVQDGCDNFCTFCIIPRVRGRARSRPAAHVLREVREALDRGSRELVLTGVNMSRYRDGNTNGGSPRGFTDLVRAVLDVPGEFRVRISSLEPDGLDESFLELFDHPRMCPHLHLCLQSGSDRVLLAMRRMYTVAAYRELARGLRDKDPRFNLTTDVITGFPGETERDLEDTVAAIKEYQFGHVHVFPFSVRSGTRAERLPGAPGTPGELSEGEKRRRGARVRAGATRQKRAYRESLVGTVETVLVERVETGRDGARIGVGLGAHYVPVRFSAESPVKENEFHQVAITGLEEARHDLYLRGVAIPFHGA